MSEKQNIGQHLDSVVNNLATKDDLANVQASLAMQMTDLALMVKASTAAIIDTVNSNNADLVEQATEPPWHSDHIKIQGPVIRARSTKNR